MVSIVNYVQITPAEITYALDRAEDAAKLESTLKSFGGIISQTDFETKVTQMKSYIDNLIALKTALIAIEATLP